MLNIEKYKEEIINYIENGDDLEDALICMALKHIGGCGDTNWKDLVNWLCEEYREPLLTEDEKEFLQDMMKWYTFGGIWRTSECIYVSESADDMSKGFCKIPNDSMFGKLEYGIFYTLEELGIWQ